MGHEPHGDVRVGLDLGTQGARAVAVDADGRIVGRGSRPIVGRRADGVHEQDPQDWWRAAAAACRDALHGVPPERVQAVAADSTSGTVLLVDRDGAPLTPGLMYDDARAGDQARRAEEAGGELWRKLGHRIGTSWGLPKLLWLIDRRPELLIPGARLAHQCDYLNRRLVGREVPTDWSHALKTGYDLVEVRWPEGALARLGVPGGLLPEVVRPGTVLGELGENGARETGMPRGTPVIAGMTDGCAAQIAAGALHEGSWSSALGTTLALKGASAEPVHDPNGVLYCHRSPEGGWLPGGAASAGAGVLSTRFAGRDLDELGECAARHERTDVLAYPLDGRGERFPFRAPDAEGFLLGAPASDGERFAALLHGLAFLERLCFDYLDMLGARTDGELRLTGGATRGRHLSQLRADVLGRQVRLLESADPATGMAVLAGCRGRGLAEAASATARVREALDPRAEAGSRLREGYLRFVAELERRGWLDGALAGHARAGA